MQVLVVAETATQPLTVNAGFPVGAILVGVGVLVWLRLSKKGGRRTQAIVDAGLKAIPGVIAAGAGAVGVTVGVAYFMFMGLYFIVNLVIASIIDAFTHEQFRPGPIYGELAGTGARWTIAGVVVLGLGTLWLGVVIGQALQRVSSNAPPASAGPAVEPPIAPVVEPSIAPAVEPPRETPGEVVPTGPPRPRRRKRPAKQP
ncbi:MAG: hypothetical protein QOK05_2563 [Chloroflexota bacterium]|nr:hypothetical protein [Chloroflexota bacterium]